MKLRHLALACLVLTSAGCTPRASTPSPEDMASAVQAVALTLVAQTAAAASPTPLPTETATPLPPNTPTLNATATPSHRKPITKQTAGCWFGPGPTYTLESNINPEQRVELLGVGSVTGWYIIRNPYFHRPCWMEAANLDIDPGIDLAGFPMMTPGEPMAGQ